MIKSLKLALPLLLIATPLAAQEPVPEPDGPVTRQTAVRESPLLDYEYSWPQAISAETQLVAKLNADLSKTYYEALKEARETKALVDQNNGPFHQNSFSRIWTVEGQTPRLLSLVSNTDTYTGGAHPNHSSSALLWDRTAREQVQLTSLFRSANGLEDAIRATFCKLLDAERAKRREGETLDGEFSQCPPFSDLTIYPADENGTGPFESIHLVADPYVAGPYAEGSYEIAVSTSGEVIAALKPEYRAEFEVQAQ